MNPRFPAAALALLMGTWPPSVASATERQSDAVTEIAFFSLSPVDTDAAYTIPGVMELQQQAAEDLQGTTATGSLEPTDVVTGESVDDDIDVVADAVGSEIGVVSTTERGYKLRSPGRRIPSQPDYIYESDWVYAVLFACRNNCYTESTVRLKMRQYVFGGESKSWRLTLSAQHWSGSTAYVTWFQYQCAVNIKDATDKYCNSFKSDGADGYESGSFYNGNSFTYYFGSYYTVTKFPMEKLHVTWASGARAIGDDGQPGEKFRGWDVCVRATSTKLCSASGQGG